jgi:hypothetical protein
MKNLIIIFGLPGTGHHLLFDLLRNNNFKNITNEITNELKNLTSNTNNFKEGNYFYSTSFPYGIYLNNDNKINIKQLLNLLLKKYFDFNLLFIMLSRNIIHSTLSVYNRFYKSKYEIDYLVKNQIKNLKYLKENYPLIKNNKIIIEYEKILENPNEYIDRINTILNTEIKLLIDIRKNKNYKEDINYIKIKENYELYNIKNLYDF